MADNVILPGIGAIVKTEEAGGPGGPHVQAIFLNGPLGETVPYDAVHGYKVDVGRVQGTVVVSGPVTDAQLRATAISITPAPVATAAIAAVAGSAASVAIRAANVNRKGLIIFNDSTAILRVAFGVAAAALVYTVKIQPQGYWEMPQPIYTGVVNGIWDAANGNAIVTEVTP